MAALVDTKEASGDTPPRAGSCRNGITKWSPPGKVSCHFRVRFRIAPVSGFALPTAPAWTKSPPVQLRVVDPHSVAVEAAANRSDAPNKSPVEKRVRKNTAKTWNPSATARFCCLPMKENGAADVQNGRRRQPTPPDKAHYFFPEALFSLEVALASNSKSSSPLL